MTLNGVMPVISRRLTEFSSFGVNYVKVWWKLDPHYLQKMYPKTTVFRQHLWFMVIFSEKVRSREVTHSKRYVQHCAAMSAIAELLLPLPLVLTLIVAHYAEALNALRQVNTCVFSAEMTALCWA